MRAVLGFVMVLGAIACGRAEPESAVEVQPAPIVLDVAAEVAAAPVGVASGLELGVIYAGNMMGELEPCG